MGVMLEGKVCLVTGAGKGIGREIVDVFHQQGAKLGIITRSEDDINRLRDELNIDEACFLTMSGDVSDRVVVDGFVRAVIEKYGNIDVLVNNAGMRFRKDFLDITPSEFKTVMDVNLGSVFYLSQAVLPHMIKQKQGKIINMASVAGTLGLPQLSGYVTSKAAIIGLSKSLALEFAEQNIQINVIAPGFTKTSYFENFKQKDDLYNFTLERTPMRRWGDSVEVANACLFLASHLSDFITGEVLNVDGGWSAW